MGDTTCSFQLNLNSDFQNTYLTEETKASYPLAFFMCTCALQAFSDCSSKSSHCASSCDSWSSVFFN